MPEIEDQLFELLNENEGKLNGMAKSIIARGLKLRWLKRRHYQEWAKNARSRGDHRIVSNNEIIEDTEVITNTILKIEERYQQLKVKKIDIHRNDFFLLNEDKIIIGDIQTDKELFLKINPIQELTEEIIKKSS